MSELSPERLRHALRQAAHAWVPARPPGDSRARVLAAVHRRRRQRNGVLLTAGLAAVLGLLVVPMVVARDGGDHLLVQGGASAPSAPAGGGAPSQLSGDLPSGGAAATDQEDAADGPETPGARARTGPSTTLQGTGTPATTTTVDGDPAPTVTVTTAPTETPGPVIMTGGSGVTGTVRISPVCPVERDPPDPACAPRPASAAIRLLRDGAVVASGRAGDDGDFQIGVDPGHYVIEATRTGAHPAIGSGCHSEPGEVDVEDGAYADVTVVCDTGIR